MKNDGSCLAVIDHNPVYEFNLYRGSELIKRIRHQAGNGCDVESVCDSSGTWEVCQQLSGNPDDDAGRQMRFMFTRHGGACPDASVGVAFHLRDWSEDVHAFMPGALYNGNRFRSYSCGWYGCYAREDVRPYSDQIVSDIPRLNSEKGAASRVQLLTRDLAAPAAGFWYPDKKLGLIFLTDQGDVRGDTLLEIEENAAHDDAWVRFTMPGVREKKHTLEGMSISPDRGVSFRDGDILTLKLAIWYFACDDLRCFHKFFFKIRKAYLPDRRELPGVTLSRALAFQKQVVSADRWSEEHRLFRDEEGPPWYFQTGWTGGIIKDYPVYATGTAEDRDHVRTALRTYNEGWSPSGLMYGRFDPSGMWTSDNDVPQFPPLASRPYMKNWTLSRRHGDVLHYLLKTAALISLTEPGAEQSADFYERLRRSADVLCRTFEKHGQLGQYLDQDTGDLVLGGSTAAASVPAGLVQAWRRFGDGRYLKTAEALAVQLYENYAACGNMNGTPADIMQSPDCEGPTLLLEGLCDLYDATGAVTWRDKAEHCAWLLSTWVLSYDYDFSRHFPGCEFDRLGLKTAGAVIASVQNRIGTPGLCVGSGLALLRLYRVTGEVRYLDLLRDVVSCQLRAMARPERPSYGEDGSLIPAGWIAERFSTTDVHMPGVFWKASTPWCQTALMLACLELPGLYVVTDRAFVYALDAVRVDAVERQTDGLRLTLTNPTEFPARYALMAESSADQLRPLPQFHFSGFSFLDFQAGETRQIKIHA